MLHYVSLFTRIRAAEKKGIFWEEEDTVFAKSIITCNPICTNTRRVVAAIAFILVFLRSHFYVLMKFYYDTMNF